MWQPGDKLRTLSTGRGWEASGQAMASEEEVQAFLHCCNPQTLSTMSQVLEIVVSGRGRHGLCSMKLTIKCWDTYVICKILQQLWNYNCDKWVAWYHEIRIMKDFRFRALSLSNSTTPTSFAKVLKTGKCHLPGSLVIWKALGKWNQSPPLERMERCSIYWVIHCVHTSRGCRPRVSSHVNTQGLVTGGILKKTMFGTTVPPRAAGHWSK